MTFLGMMDKYEVTIPIIQRDYAQGRQTSKVKEIRDRFLESLYTALVNPNDFLNLDFIYGSVRDGVLYPLDGQQRLTTLFLLHWYLAVRDKEIEGVQQKLEKFTYQIRTSSREFCSALVKNSDAFEKNENFALLESISSKLKDANWFFWSWEKDPTIKSMLVMLDAIHNKFKETSIQLFERLIDNERCPVTFQFIPLEDFNLDDDLYIKMNARGKELTDFENFKAGFQQFLQQKESEGALTSAYLQEFIQKIDGDWTDLFWDYRNKASNLFDNQFMNFFKAMIINQFALLLTPSEENKKIQDLIEDKEYISFRKYNELGCFDNDFINGIYYTLETLKSNTGGIKKYFSGQLTGVNEEELFKKIINNPQELTYTDRVQFFALYRYFKKCKSKVNKEEIGLWMRVIRNLSENTIYNKGADFISSVEAITALIEYSSNILEFLCKEKNEITGFWGKQVTEEKIKAILILKSSRWKQIILAAENHGYFTGQIGFILNFSGIEQAYSSDKKLCWKPSIEDDYFKMFKNYYDKAGVVFNETGLKASGDLWRRALLSKGEYLLKYRSNLSFLIDSKKDRDISWKRLLRDDNDERKYVKVLLDDINIQNITSSLQKVIDNSNITDWRKYFIKYPNLIETDCGSTKSIKYINEQEIFLLGYSIASGKNKEYYTYILYLELKKSGVKNLEYQIEGKGIWRYCHYLKIKQGNMLNEVIYEDGKYKIGNLYEKQGRWEFKIKKEFLTQDEILHYLKN